MNNTQTESTSNVICRTTVDVVTEDISLDCFKNEAENKGLKMKIINEIGPAGGWPEVELIGYKDSLVKFLEESGYEDYDEFIEKID